MHAYPLTTDLYELTRHSKESIFRSIWQVPVSNYDIVCGCKIAPDDWVISDSDEQVVAVLLTITSLASRYLLSRPRAEAAHAAITRSSREALL